MVANSITAGEKFNKWTFLYYVQKDKFNRNIAMFRCECGTKKNHIPCTVVSGRSKCCAKCASRIQMTVGDKFNLLEFISDVGMDNNSWLGKFKCRCGNETTLRISDVYRGATKSCGCLKRRKGSLCPTSKDRGQSALHSFYSQYKRTAARREIDFNLTETEFKDITGKNCFYCGEQPTEKFSSRHNGGYVGNGIDRFNNDVGYIMSNCKPCCLRCNMAKGESSMKEFIAWAKKFLLFQKENDANIHCNSNF